MAISIIPSNMFLGFGDGIYDGNLAPRKSYPPKQAKVHEIRIVCGMVLVD